MTLFKAENGRMAINGMCECTWYNKPKAYPYCVGSPHMAE